MKKIVSILISIILSWTINAATLTHAQSSFRIRPSSNSNSLDRISPFLKKFNLDKVCLRNKKNIEKNTLTAYIGVCLNLQVFDEERLNISKAWNKAKKISLIPSNQKRNKKLNTLEYLTILFKSAGISISPVSLREYRKRLRKLRLSLSKKEDLETLAIALENKVINSPITLQESRNLRKELTKPITIAKAIDQLYQVSLISFEENLTVIIPSHRPSESGSFALENVMRKIIETIRERSLFSQSFDEQKAVEKAIKALVNSLKEDKYIEFYTEDEFQAFSSDLNGNLEGIGAYIEKQEEKLIIISPIGGSPALDAGLQAGDIITHIDGESTKGLTLQEAVRKIRGPKGTRVQLIIVRDGQTMTFNIKRTELSIPTVTSGNGREGIAIFKINQFGSTVAQETLDAWTEIADKNPRGIIFDLRNNPGGFLNEVVTILDYFLKKGDPIVYLDDHKTRTEIKSQNDPIISNIPIAILINKGSASASEILAGTLQSYGLAKIYGETSFGKGTVQEIITLHDPDLNITPAFKLTTSEYKIPIPKEKGQAKSINKIGIKPDSNPAGTNSVLVDDPQTLIDEALEVVLDSF